MYYFPSGASHVPIMCYSVHVYCVLRSLCCSMWPGIVFLGGRHSIFLFSPCCLLVTRCVYFIRMFIFLVLRFGVPDLVFYLGFSCFWSLVCFRPRIYYFRKSYFFRRLVFWLSIFCMFCIISSFSCVLGMLFLFFWVPPIYHVLFDFVIFISCIFTG